MAARELLAGDELPETDLVHSAGQPLIEALYPTATDEEKTTLYTYLSDWALEYILLSSVLGGADTARSRLQQAFYTTTHVSDNMNAIEGGLLTLDTMMPNGALVDEAGQNRRLNAMLSGSCNNMGRDKGYVMQEFWQILAAGLMKVTIADRLGVSVLKAAVEESYAKIEDIMFILMILQENPHIALPAHFEAVDMKRFIGKPDLHKDGFIFVKRGAIDAKRAALLDYGVNSMVYIQGVSGDLNRFHRNLDGIGARVLCGTALIGNSEVKGQKFAITAKDAIIMPSSCSDVYLLTGSMRHRNTSFQNVQIEVGNSIIQYGKTYDPEHLLYQSHVLHGGRLVKTGKPNSVNITADGGEII